jgi:hypothetical protein
MKKVKTAIPESQEHSPVLVWQMPKQTVLETASNWDTVTWTTECGRYMVGRVESLLREGEHHFSAYYSRTTMLDKWEDPPHYSKKTGEKVACISWISVEIDGSKSGQSTGRPKDYRSLGRAFEVCEQHLAEQGVKAESNAEEMLAAGLCNDTLDFI